jgi:hypothetical protein
VHHQYPSIYAGGADAASERRSIAIGASFAVPFKEIA